MTDKEIRKIIREEIKRLLNKLLNNAWREENMDTEGYTIRIANTAGKCVEQTLREYNWEDNND